MAKTGKLKNWDYLVADKGSIYDNYVLIPNFQIPYVFVSVSNENCPRKYILK